MIENLQSICINSVYVCAAGVGAAVVAYGAARGMKFLSSGVKCVSALGLVGTLIFGGLVVTNARYAAANWHLQYKEPYPTVDGGTRLGLSRQLRRLTDTYTRQDCIEVYFIGDLSNSRTIGVKTDYGVIITKAATSQTLAHELAHVLGLADCYEKANGLLIDHGNEPVTKERLLHYDRDWGRECGRGFYEKDDTLVKIIQSYLMNGISMSARIDIPHGAVHAWAKKDQNVKDFIHVGARYLKPSWEVYSK